MPHNRTNRSKSVLLVSTALAGLAAAPALAADGVLPGDTIFVTASRAPAEAYTIGNAISVLTAEDIEQRQNPVISDLLRSVPGIAVSRSGGPGQLTQVRMRGAEGNHTLVLVDGVEANELNFNGEFDFASLMAVGIERIEVLRGAQSALYGSDALGGVINIITKGGMPGFSAEAAIEGGSFAERQATMLLRGGSERLNGAFSAGYYGTDGTNLSRYGSEKDGARVFSFSGKGMAQVTDNFRIDAVGRYVTSKNDTDAQDFNWPPTPTEGLVIDTLDQQKNQLFYGRVQGELSLFEDHWVHQASVQYSDTRREYINPSDDLTGNHGSRLKFEYQNTVNFQTPSFLDADHHVTVAFEREEQDFENHGAVPDALENQKRSEPQNSYIAEYRVGLADQLFLSAGIRHDDNRMFRNATTYRLAAAWQHKQTGTRLHASHGTAVTNPGFFELFGYYPDFFIGNPALKPEESRSFDVGIEQKFLGDRLTLDVTYFHANLENEIVTVFAGFSTTVENLVGKSRRNGVEVMLSAQLTDNLSIGGSYTYTDSRQPGGAPEVRRPRHMGNFNANYGFAAGRGNVNLDVSYNGRQLDNEFASSTPESIVTLNDYVLVTLAASYKLTDSLEIYGRIENLVDQHYEEVFSYRSPGIGAFGGLRLKLGD
ncbi:TonB-dependent receptor [Emcibacter sp. SYSU 3D8]|uniref:TonB-dependent receptor plug domain-containing protein n=1 Tax=Emcibacter sp. SYSU 3D8 TaxID=3133969 RepID=UPI0031FE9053